MINPTPATDKRKRRRPGRQATRLIVLFVTVAIFLATENRRVTQVNAPSQSKDISLATSQSNGFEFTRSYTAGMAENYIFEHMDELGYNVSIPAPGTCNIWQNPETTSKEVWAYLRQYERDLEKYNEVINSFSGVPNLMKTIKKNAGNHEVCDSLRVHPDGLAGLFPSNQLSLTSHGGFVEPLLPPFRSSLICHPSTHQTRRYHMMSLEYLVHDFEAMCHKLKPHSKLVLIDMGASFDFVGKSSPMTKLLALYEKMGFIFDHIYGFEITPKDANKIYKNQLLEKYMASYHWINVGVEAGERGKLNPLHSIVRAFDEDDFVVVKMDIDTPSIEVPLFKQLVFNDELTKLVDQFYFEHHVFLGELAWDWGKTMSGTVKDSLTFFSTLRKKGVAAHPWP